MRKIFFVVLCLCAWDTAVYAAASCGDEDPNGCAAGEYCAASGVTDVQLSCQPCPEGFPHSAAGSVDIKDCYKICGKEDDWPDSEDFDTENGRLELNDDSAEEIHYISEYQTGVCLYNLVCNDEHNKCDGYHLAVDGYSCQPNKQECIEENGRGIQVWYKGEYSGCYITSCNEGCVLGPTASGTPALPQICEQEYGACECEGNFSDACDRWLSGCNGQILSKGEVKWDAGKGWWNFENCYCKTEGVNVDGGKGTTTCFYASSDKYGGNTKWSTDCEVRVSSCNSGYCVQGGDFSKCVPAPFGYYAAAENLVCQACPDAGTTTESVGAKSAAACGMVRGVGGTRFCDNEGCFYLPGTGFIQKAN